MKIGIRSLVCVALALLGVQRVSASLAVWNFSSTASGPLSGYSSSSSDPSFGSSTLSTSLGTTPNVSGGVLSYSFAKGSVASLDNSVLAFTVHTGSLGINNLSVAYTAGFTTINQLSGTWSYSIGGGAFTGIGSENITSGANTDTAGWNTISIGANQTVTFQFVLSGAAAGNSGQAGTLTFDDWTFNGSTFNPSPVPEPMNYSLAAFGLVFIGGSAGRFYFRRKARTAEAV